jgi:type III pantothenate kinase
MHTFTENLPFVDINKQEKVSLVGKSTTESMESGVYNGTIAEIEQTINQFKVIYKDLTAIITGGDHKLFELHLKNEIFAQPNLQAIGLNRILLHNAM